MEDLLSFEDISFVREQRNILSNISWKVKQGEQWAILGLNGSGKSTLLSMLPAYQFPSSGKLKAFGLEFGKEDWTRVKENISYVSSSLELFSSTLEKCKLKDIILSGKFYSIGLYQKVCQEDYQRVEELAKSFHLEALLEHPYSSLSQGEKRKALLARAYMSECKLLILDEPCTGFDIRSRENFLQSLEKSIQKNPEIATLYVTHQVEEILPSVTHVAILEEGKMKYQGKKEEILTENILSELFQVDILIHWHAGRAWIQVKS